MDRAKGVLTMLSQLQFSPNYIDFQARFNHQRVQFKILINRFVPHCFIDRRNAGNTKFADEDLLALMCLKVYYQLTTWMALYRLVKNILPGLTMIEYSRFTRRIKQMGPVLQVIRQGLSSWTNPGLVAIIDSYPLRQNDRNIPVLLCFAYPIRNHDKPGMGTDREQLPKRAVCPRFSRFPHYDMRRHLRRPCQ